MSALSREIEELERENRRIARDGVLAIVEFQSQPTPSLLQAIQDEIRRGLLFVEHRLRVIEKAKRRWREHGKNRFLARPDVRRARATRVQSLKSRDQLLRDRAMLLKQLGDSCAWVLLGMNPRLLRVLYSTDQVHHLPSEVGLAGNVEIAAITNRSGLFFAIENDLTRVLGIGDVTVVPVGKRWLKPLILEIKSSGDFEVGAEIGIGIYTSVAELTPDEELLHEFNRTLGMSLVDVDDNEIYGKGKASAQIRKIKDTSDVLLRIATETVERLRAPRQSLWPHIENVLIKARQNGSAYHLAEPGVVIAAIRDGESNKTVAKLFEEVEHRGLSRGGRQFHAASSQDLRSEATISPFSVPIALWPINSRLRADLLSGKLFYLCIWDPSVWTTAFASERICLVHDEDGWLLKKDGDEGRFDVLEVERIVSGLPYSGISPGEVARVTAASFKGSLNE